MFALKRITRFKLSLKNQLHTSSVIRCDKPKDPESVKNKPASNKKAPTQRNKPLAASSNESKKKLTAELSAEDYANFKSQKQLQKSDSSNEISRGEKLQTLSKNKGTGASVDSSASGKLKTSSVPGLKRETKNKDANLKKELVKSAKAVAMELGGNTTKTEKDILQYLKAVEVQTEIRGSKQDDNSGAVNKLHTTPSHSRQGQGRYRESYPSFEKEKKAHVYDTREQNMKHTDRTQNDFEKSMPEGPEDYKRHQNEMKIWDVLYQRYSGVKPLGIFDPKALNNKGPKLKVWDELEELELMAAATIPPRNYFEELIQWTKEGKLWHFPIDNDQGNEMEANIDFTEHVFLEEHLEPWCPKRGPLRHFMELVATGLAKNHYLSVEEKKEHIFWYRDYFEEKKKLLQGMGVLDGARVLEKSEESASQTESPT